MAAILSYGSYVPYCRLPRERLGAGEKGERAIASFDEDATSLAVEAGREAIRGSATAPGTLLFASTSHPYAEKLNAAAVHAALDLPPEARLADLSSSSGAGLAALGIAAATQAEAPTLVCCADVVVGAPLGAREAQGGDAACAFLVGNGDGAAQILGCASHAEELLDVWRGAEQQFVRQWEERFAQQRLVPALASALERALAESGLGPSDLKRVAVDSGHSKVGSLLARASGLGPDQLADDLSASVGRAGAAHAGLLLASLLDSAEPGDAFAVLSAADGAHALIVRAAENIADHRPRHAVAGWIQSKRSGVAYETYLKWREILPFEPPRRPDPPRPAAPPMRRSERWKYAFVGARCRACGAVNLPPQVVCVQCREAGEMEDAPYADEIARVATYTIDHLAYSLQPPVVAAVIDYERGGRFDCELADVEPDKVAIGQELEMTFRRLYTADGVRNYFWKARPRR